MTVSVLLLVNSACTADPTTAVEWHPTMVTQPDPNSPDLFAVVWVNTKGETKESGLFTFIRLLRPDDVPGRTQLAMVGAFRDFSPADSLTYMNTRIADAARDHLPVAFVGEQGVWDDSNKKDYVLWNGQQSDGHRFISDSLVRVDSPSDSPLFMDGVPVTRGEDGVEGATDDANRPSRTLIVGVEAKAHSDYIRSFGLVDNKLVYIVSDYTTGTDTLHWGDVTYAKGDIIWCPLASGDGLQAASVVGDDSTGMTFYLANVTKDGVKEEQVPESQYKDVENSCYSKPNPSYDALTPEQERALDIQSAPVTP